MRPSTRGSCKGRSNRKEVPTEGSTARVVYDLLINNKAYPVSLKHILRKRRKGLADYLRTFYGLDVRTFNSEPGQVLWWLVGQWNEAEYVDYLVERYNKEKKEI